MIKIFSKMEVTIYTALITFISMSMITFTYPIFLPIAEAIGLDIIFATDILMYVAIFVFNGMMMLVFLRLNHKKEKMGLEPYKIVDEKGKRNRIIGVLLLHALFWWSILTGHNYKLVILTTATFEIFRLWFFPTLWTNKEGFSVGNKHFTYSSIKSAEERFGTNLEITMKETEKVEIVLLRSLKNRDRLVKLLGRKRLMAKPVKK